MDDSSNSPDDPTKPEGDVQTPEDRSSGSSARPVLFKADKDPPQESSLIAGETLQQVGASSVGEIPIEQPQSRAVASTGKSAFLVGAGILISRIVGLVRQRIFAHYFGTSGAGDAFTAAFRIPNFLQNVFGEGALSASFIPVYAKLLAQGDEKEATRIANAVFGLLALVTSLIVLFGVLATPLFVAAIAGGFQDDRRELTIRLVRILFPGAGLLVLSAWCLGVLNSHHRFFVSYTAPVAWNVLIIAALVFYGRRLDLFPLAEVAAWGSVVGSALQFGVQLPTVLRLIHRFRPIIDIGNAHVKEVVHNFFPVFMSRGVVQISAFVDAEFASFLGRGAVVALNYAQSLYTLPVSLFGMAVSAAELPTMAKALGAAEVIAETLRHRLDAGLQRIAFFIVPSSMAFLALGDVIAAVLYQTGQFKHDDAIYVWAILAGSAVGLLASTLGRLYSSTYYALHDTRTPLRYAIVRVALTTVLGYLCALPLPRLLGIDPKWGVAGLTASAGIAGWVEFVLLRRTLNKRIGQTGLASSYVGKLWLGATAGAGAGWAFKLLLGPWHPIPLAIAVLGAYGTTYFGITAAFGLPEARNVIGRLVRVSRVLKR
jgi:putative peptidoglycan lipid II flippase